MDNVGVSCGPLPLLFTVNCIKGFSFAWRPSCSSMHDSVNGILLPAQCVVHACKCEAALRSNRHFVYLAVAFLFLQSLSAYAVPTELNPSTAAACVATR